MTFTLALCCRSFRDHTLVFVQTKHLAHKLRIVLGLQGLKATELHGNLTQLQVIFTASSRSLAYFTNELIEWFT